ncbi:DUF5049 domain-containing protein [Anaerocolumna sedimenticola]|uniref:DUF5049 domain-containing protein n=1 Tax=Anaerocolumna sedimenticola TaxID=2696063 RepID=A0A6P1TVE1_9FIRM|nr:MULTISPECIES: DUF5049 domain-containing protein [Anaerocolumna]QHQ63448.1 DUF5049 domain-containing protein [Anaerocolumna sedimenticola]
MTEEIRDQILAIRDTGETNMFNIPVVIDIAERDGYYELIDYLSDHRDDYVRFILTGETME